MRKKGAAFLFILALLLAGCLQIEVRADREGAKLFEVVLITPTQEPTRASMPTPAHPRRSPTATERSLTRTPSPSPQSPILVRTASPTPTRPITTTSPPAAPVTYDIRSCMVVSLGGNNQVIECVTSVTILPDESMQFHFSWTAQLVPQFEVPKTSDRGNTNMYLTDNQNNRYDHMDVGGFADQDVILLDGVSVSGWFLFPPPGQDVDYFVFHDDDNNVRTEPILKIWP